MTFALEREFNVRFSDVEAVLGPLRFPCSCVPVIQLVNLLGSMDKGLRKIIKSTYHDAR